MSAFILFLLVGICFASPPPPTAAPLFEGKPFVLIWNGPVSKCKQLQIHLDMSVFQDVTTPARVANQSLTLFYKNRIGLFPYTDQHTLKQYNGGIPQRGNLTESLTKARAEFVKYLPNTSPGLAVIDWEEWLPMFDRSLETMELYRKLSINYTRELDPSLTIEQAIRRAKWHFQTNARKYMEKTIGLGLTLRPKYLWGYYLFPDCHNYEWEDSDYTGKCSEATKELNDELLWLWKASTALYPSAYLPASMSQRYEAALFVRNQVQEALRVSALPKHPSTAPVYVYLRPLFREQKKLYLSEVDLVRSIGESAALGSSGVVLWGSSSDYNDKASCEALSSYLSDTLNPYIANVTAAASLCSKMLCQGSGRCVRKNYDSDDYLHLNPESFHIQMNNETYLATGVLSRGDVIAWADKFTCQCYANQTCSAQIPSVLPENPVIIEL
ncbi:hyaluronidase-5 [Chanos chanos]|uniref:Hyaluronidase n=1 Tax=Chanos chanos TaxID=29144 RepID=A0A6J2UNQ9_CHACN|nr:hyaluronidase-5-like [Chanos chanos]XP_030621690.1 hyaluronidase-5-like [Chanos chanos]XP_030621691.1 hyaluronidase-5-like [Chanos chanos]